MGAVPAYGTFLAISAGDSNANFTDLAEVRDFSITKKTNFQQTTTHASTAAVVRKTPTLTDITLKLMVNFLRNNATHDAVSGLIYIQENQLFRYFRVTYRTDVGSKVDVYRGFISNLDEKVPVDGVYSADISLEVDGAPAYAT